MRSIEVDDHVYAFLLRNTEHIGESASSILKRFLPIDAAAAPPNGKAANGNSDDGSWLLSQLDTEGFRRQRTATDKYLFVLGCAHERAPELFAKVLTVSGRTRKYFGASEADITSSGTKTYPQRIPGTRYWAMTNASTGDKRDMLRRALQQLGYNSHVADRASRSIA